MGHNSVDLSGYTSNFGRKNKIYRILWVLVYQSLFRPLFLNVFLGWRRFLLRLFGAQIGKNVVVHSSVKIWAPYNLVMGDYSCLGPNVDCYNQGAITIGAHTVISQKCYLCASSHDVSDRFNSLILKPIVIDDQVWVAADAFIGPGVHIKQGAVVGARSSVFKDVEMWTIVGGNPAVFLKNRTIRKTE